MEIAGTSNAASIWPQSTAARTGGAVAGTSNPGASSGSTVTQPVDQYLPGTRHRPKKGKGNYKKPKVRRPPAPKLDPEQLQARHAMQKRLDQQRMSAAIEKSGMYLPAPPVPLPALAALTATPALIPPTPRIEPPALPVPEAPAGTLAETAEAAAISQDPTIVNIGPGKMDITAEMLEKESPESSGVLGTALGVGLAASALTAYIARDSLNPLVGAQIIGEAAVDAAPAVLDGALWLGPKIVDGAVWLGPKAVDAAVTLGPQAVDGALWLGPKIVEGTTDFIANAPGYLQTGVNGLQTAGEAVVDAGTATAEAVVDATPVVIEGAQDFANFVQNFKMPSGSAPTDSSSPFTLDNIASDPGAAVIAAVTDPAAAGAAAADALGSTPAAISEGTQDVVTSVSDLFG